MKEKQIIVVLILLAVSVITYLWWQNNQKAIKYRGTKKYRGPNAGSRASDLRILSPQEEKIRDRAKRLIAKGQIRQAAQMLEQIGMHRDAITALENAKLIDDAARVLLRMQNPARAGVVYSRNGRWKEAAQCFIQAGNLTDAATCMREAGNFFEAADLFLKENQIENAAECFERSGRWLEASRAWSKAGKGDRSLGCWREIGNNLSLLKGQTPTHEEVELLFTLAKSGELNPGIINLIASSSKLNQMILTAVNEGHRRLSEELLKAAPPHIIPTLISEVNLQSPQAKMLADLLDERGECRFAAMLYEQLALYELAADSFQKAGETDRANYCRERLGRPSTKKSAEAKPVTPSPPSTQFTAVPSKGNFFIETGSFSAKANPTDGQGTPESESVPVPTATAPSPLQTLLLNNSDEAALIKASWLFDQLTDDERSLIAKSFKVMNLTKDGMIQSGSPSSFLVYVVRGELQSDQGARVAGQWLSPELAMSGAAPVSWAATAACRTLVMTASDFDQLIGSNAAVMRKVFTNLTRQSLGVQDNHLKSKAV